MAGFMTAVVVVEDDIQALMYQMPTVEQEKAGVDYYDYQSPDELRPLVGILAAEAVRLLAQLLMHAALCVNTPFQVPLCRELELPGEVTYEYVPVLQAICKRTVLDVQGAQGTAEGVQETVAGPGVRPAVMTAAATAPIISALKGCAKVGSRKRKACHSAAEANDLVDDEDDDVVEEYAEVEEEEADDEENPLDELAVLSWMKRKHCPGAKKLSKVKAKAKNQ